MRDKYKNLSEEEKEQIKIYQQKHREKMKNNITEAKKENLREHQKNYRNNKD